MILIYLIANFLFNIYFDSESLSKVDVDSKEKIGYRSFGIVIRTIALELPQVEI